MRLTARPLDLSGLVVSPEQETVRSTGLHVSAIIQYLAKTIGRKEENEFTRADLDMFALIGRLWESQLAAAAFKPPRYERIGEVKLDGIIGSPDAIDTVDWSVQEYKATFRSVSRPIESEVEWFWQVKAYCHMLGTARASLFVFYSAGNWRPPVPVGKAWDIQFSPGELKDNWRMLRQAVKEMSK